jgi:hypothetical protein
MLSNRAAMASPLSNETWPRLPYDEWQETLATLHLWFQIVGKIRLAQAPAVNHWWHVTLYVTPRGLTTSSMPYGTRTFEIAFDFIDHELSIQDSRGTAIRFPLAPMPVSRFYSCVMEALKSMDIEVSIRTTPSEIANAIPFELDISHGVYDYDHAERYWRALLQANRVLQMFRARFMGKVSPVHFFWGAPDLAVTRFSGRIAPPHPGGIPNIPDWVTREAYSREVSSAGWWPGAPGIEPMFYSYAYPEPAGFAQAAISPEAAHYHAQLREWILPYDAVRVSDDPDATLLSFLQSTYDAAANLAKWDRQALER